MQLQPSPVRFPLTPPIVPSSSGYLPPITMSTRPPMSTSPPARRIPNNIMRSDPRAKYYAKLAIFPPAPSAPGQARRSPLRPALLAKRASPPPSPPCLRHKRSVLHTTPAKERRVSWNQNVRLYRIPSHVDYSDEEWDGMWVDGGTLDYEKDRNTFEFTADGADWQNVTEEDDFQEAPDGALVHPATWLAYRHHWERHGSASPRAVDFRSLLRQIPAQVRSFSPRPIKRKTFWLFDLAIESVQKGKSAFSDRRPPSPLMSSRVKPPRKSDRGAP